MYLCFKIHITESTKQGKNMSDFDGLLMKDTSVILVNPHNWDLIEDLNKIYSDYYDPACFYRELGKHLPSYSNQTFFNNGAVIYSQPGDTVDDVFKKYEEKENKNSVKEWGKLFSYFLPYDLSLIKDKQTREFIHPYSIQDFNKKNSELLLKVIQKMFFKSKSKITAGDLKYAYDIVTCGDNDIKNNMPLEFLGQNDMFIDLVRRWRYTSKIAHLFKNDKLRKELRGRLDDKIKITSIRNSSKWFEKYEIYKKTLNQSDSYNLTYFSLFRDRNQFGSCDYNESFDIAKQDLFNPLSDFYINHLIKAVISRPVPDKCSSIPENIVIKNDFKKHRILFGEQEKQDWKIIDMQKQLPNDSIYCLKNQSFGQIADWHKQKMFQSTRNNALAKYYTK